MLHTVVNSSGNVDDGGVNDVDEQREEVRALAVIVETHCVICLLWFI